MQIFSIYINYRKANFCRLMTAWDSKYCNKIPLYLLNKIVVSNISDYYNYIDLSNIVNLKTNQLKVVNWKLMQV